MRIGILRSLALLLLSPLPLLASQITVQKGDTLSEIALRHKVSIQSLMRLNGITNSNQLREGRKLLLPDSSSIISQNREGIHKVKQGENIEIISRKYNISPKKLIKLNNINNADYLSVGQELKIPTKQDKTNKKKDVIHTVVSGENLSTIAQLYNSSQREIITSNRLANPEYLYIGQTLTIPNVSITKRTNVVEKNNTNKYNSYHNVSSGESLISISKAYSIPLKQLILINNIKNPNEIKVGQRLYLKDKVMISAKQRNTSDQIRKKSKTNVQAGDSVKAPDWRNYGPLKIDWSNWQSLGGSYVAPGVNKNGKALYLAINCQEKKINATGSSGTWKSWISPIEKFEHDLMKDLCKLKSN